MFWYFVTNELVFSELNPHWDDERVYQEARRIVVAQLQHITYSEFLPIVIGKERLRPQGLQLRVTTYDSDYNLVRGTADMSGSLVQ